MRSVLLYVKIVYYQLKSQVQYPINAVTGFLNQFLVIFLEFVSIWALFSVFGEMDGWKLNEVFLIYGIVNFSFSMSEVFMRGFESNMTGLVRNGDYDRYLLRPMGSIWQVSAFNFQFVRLGRVFQALVVLIIGIITNISRINGIDWIVLLYSIIGGVMLYFSLYILTGLILFKVMQYTEFMSIIIQGSITTMQYPISAFPKWIQCIFTFVLPVSLVTYFPISVILGKADGGILLRYMLPFVCYGLFAVVVFLYHLVEKSYVSSGN